MRSKILTLVCYLTTIISCSQHTETTIQFDQFPHDISVAPKTSVHLSALAHTDSGLPITYKWEKQASDGSLTTISSNSTLDIVTPILTDSCDDVIDVYQVTAFSGPISVEKVFSVQTFDAQGQCPAPVIPDNAAPSDDFQLNVADEVTISPSSVLHLKATAAGNTWQFTWQQIARDGTVSELGTGPTLDYQAPSVTGQCGSALVNLRLLAVNSSISMSRTISVSVGQRLCTVDTAAYTKLLLSSKGDVYAGTENGLVRVRNDVVTRFTKGGNNRTLNSITALAQASDDTIWVGNALSTLHGYQGQGIERLNPNGDKWAIDLIKDQIQGVLVTSMDFETVNGQSDVLVATKDTASDGELTSSGGLTVLSTNLSYSNILLQQQSVFDMLVDRQGNRWVATGTEQKTGTSKGFLIYRDNKLVRQFDGSQWNGIGLTRLTDNRNIRAVVQDASGTIWFGLSTSLLQRGGLVQFNPDLQAPGELSGDWSLSPINLPRSNDVRAMVVDAKNNLWIATANGVVQRVNNIMRFFTVDNGLPSNDVRDLAYDIYTHTLWVATSKGLMRIRGIGL